MPVGFAVVGCGVVVVDVGPDDVLGGATVVVVLDVAVVVVVVVGGAVVEDVVVVVLVVVVVEDVAELPEQAGNTSNESIRATEMMMTSAGNLGCFTFMPPYFFKPLDRDY